MPELVEIVPQRIVTHLTPVLSSEPMVSAAYLFGSALEQMRADSDIDIGIIAAGISEREREALSSRLETAAGRIDGHPFDMVVLDETDVLFSFRVVHDGRPIYIADERRHGDFLERISRPHAELALRHRLALAEVLEGVRP